MGVYIRHCSKWWGKRKNVPLYEYEEAMKEIGVENKEIFISTGNQAVIDGTKEYKEYNWKYTENPRTNVNQYIGLSKKGKMDGWE